MSNLHGLVMVPPPQLDASLPVTLDINVDFGFKIEVSRNILLVLCNCGGIPRRVHWKGLLNPFFRLYKGLTSKNIN